MRWIWVRGLGSGALFGAMFGTLMVPIIGTLFGLICGIILGTASGLTTGLALMLMIWLIPRRHVFVYQLCLTLVAVCCTATINLAMMEILFTGSMLIWRVALTVVAAVFSAYFAWRLPIAQSHNEGANRPLANAVLFYTEK